jgi:hypothetical protein
VLVLLESNSRVTLAARFEGKTAAENVSLLPAIPSV